MEAVETFDSPLARFRTIVQNIPDYAIFMIDPQGFVTDWPEGAQRVKGYTPSEAIGQHVSIFYTPADQASGSVVRELNQAAAQGRTEREGWRVRKGGEWFWGNEIATAVYDSAGTLTGFTKITRDLTQRKEMEDSLRQSDERYRMLMENVRDHAIFGMDPQGQITSWNTGAQQIFGYETSEIIGHNTAILFTPEDQTNHVSEKELAIAVNDGRASDDRWQLRRNFTRFWASGVTASIRDPDGRLRGFIKILRDLTATKVLEEHRQRLFEQEKVARLEAERAITMKDEFIAVVSHELRTPLTAILLWAGMLRSGVIEAPEVNQALETIERSASAQQRLIEDLLDISRMLSGKLRANVRETELVPALEAAIEAVQPMAQAKHISLQFTLDQRTGRVNADPDRIQQVVWNLLNNAVKFTPVGGSVHLALERFDGTLQIRVSDTGRGITPEFLPFVFDRFRQADSSATRRFSGLGLGLAIARQLVELHGGTIRAESAGEGKGSTFIVELPLADMRWTLPAHQPSSNIGGGNRRFVPDSHLAGLHVLVVEDEPDTRLAIRRLLEQCNAEVPAVDSAAAALTALRAAQSNQAFDAIVSDIGMPGQDGYELMRQVRATERSNQTPRIPAVALSAYAREDDRAKASAAGFDAHLSKPVDPDTLVEALVGLTAQD